LILALSFGCYSNQNYKPKSKGSKVLVTL